MGGLRHPGRDEGVEDARTEVEIKTNYIANHDDIQGKIKAGGAGGGFDLITYYQGYKPLYAQLEILKPIDEYKLPNLENLDEFWAGDLGNFWVDEDGTRTGVPWTWTLARASPTTRRRRPRCRRTTTCSTRSSRARWRSSTTRPAPGRSARHILGMKPDEVKKADLAKVNDFLSQIIAQSSGVSPSFGDVTTKLTVGRRGRRLPGLDGGQQVRGGRGHEDDQAHDPEGGRVHRLRLLGDRVDRRQRRRGLLLDERDARARRSTPPPPTT